MLYQLSYLAGLEYARGTRAGTQFTRKAEYNTHFRLGTFVVKESSHVMPARIERFAFPPVATEQPRARRRFSPTLALGCGALTAVVAVMLKRARQPSMGRMSDEWLFSQQREFNRPDSY